MNLKLDELTKEELQKIIEKIAKRLSKEQYEYLQHLITDCLLYTSHKQCQSRLRGLMLRIQSRKGLH